MPAERALALSCFQLYQNKETGDQSAYSDKVENWSLNKLCQIQLFSLWLSQKFLFLQTETWFPTFMEIWKGNYCLNPN